MPEAAYSRAVAETRSQWMVRMMEIWNAGEYERFLDGLGPELEFTSGRSSWPGVVLADSPVNGCMLMSTRLGCLKKPT